MSYLHLEATGPGYIPEIIRLLGEAFGSSDTPNFQPDLLRWKYYDPWGSSTGSRSYALLKGDALVAHACAWPIRLATRDGPVNAIQMLDWVSSKSAAGAGVTLARKLEALASVLITCGGSPDTHRILPRIGFARRGSFTLHARVLRPWRQFRTRPSEGAKTAARLIRNTLWSRSRLSNYRGWAARPLTHPDAELLSRFEAEPVNEPESRYCPDFLEFMSRCPGARIGSFALLKESRPQGYFVLSRTGGQTRLADLRILSKQAEDWAAAYAVAVDAAAEDREACELVASAYVPRVAAALHANGFRVRGSGPVFVRDPQGLLAVNEPIHLSMLDDDSAFLNFPEHPYMT